MTTNVCRQTRLAANMICSAPGFHQRKLCLRLVSLATASAILNASLRKELYLQFAFDAVFILQDVLKNSFRLLLQQFDRLPIFFSKLTE